MLSDIASKGGNFLLNIGPMADGTIPPESVERLQAVGRWMDVNGEAIHATQAGPFPRRLPWGRVTQKPSAEGGTVYYLHIWDWPADGKVLLPTLRQLPSSGKMLVSGAAVTAEQTPDGVLVHLPGNATDPDVSVARLDFSGQPTITQQPYAIPAADGSITLLAHDADPHGAVGGNIRLEGTGAEAYLTDWTRPNYYVEYQVKTETAGKFRFECELACAENSKLAVGLEKSPVPVEIAATGPGITWKTVALGSINLPAGEATVVLKPDMKHWKPVHLRKLQLVPTGD
jgi:alpha-L-fucosidase